MSKIHLQINKKFYVGYATRVVTVETSYY